MHDLGLKFNTSTINLWFSPSDFLKFLSEPQQYIYNNELIEDTEMEIKFGYPVGVLSDIRIFFQHYSSFEEARYKWNERSKRIIWDEIYVIMCEKDGCMLEHIQRFDSLPYKNKVIFTVKEMSNIQSAYFLSNAVDSDGKLKSLINYKGKFTGKRWIDDFDYVSWINGS